MHAPRYPSSFECNNVMFWQCHPNCLPHRSVGWGVADHEQLRPKRDIPLPRNHFLTSFKWKRQCKTSRTVKALDQQLQEHTRTRRTTTSINFQLQQPQAPRLQDEVWGAQTLCPPPAKTWANDLGTTTGHANAGQFLGYCLRIAKQMQQHSAIQRTIKKFLESTLNSQAACNNRKGQRPPLQKLAEFNSTSS